MGYEKRGLRPFETMDETQKALDLYLRVQSPRIPDGFQPAVGNMALTPHGVGDGGSIAARNGTVLLDPGQFVTNTFGLYFGTHVDHWQEMTRAVISDIERIFGKVADAPVNLLVTATNKRLRQMQILLNEPVSEWLGNDLEWRRTIVEAGNNSIRPRPFRMPQDGCEINVQFVLRDNLPQKLRVLGRPDRKGSWLARWVIKVSATKGSGLAPRPLTPEIRQINRLGDGCTSFIDFRGDYSGLCKLNNLADVLTVYIDQELLTRASEQNRNGEPICAASNSVITRIVMDTYRSLIHALSHDDQLTDFDPENTEDRYTFTFLLIEKVANYAAISEAESLNILRELPNKFMSLLEGANNLVMSDRALLNLKGS